MTSTGVLSRLGRILTGPGVPRSEGQRVPVWLTRLQQNDNLLLRANRLERRGRFADARRFYLQDVDHQGGRGLHARAGVARAASAEMTSPFGTSKSSRTRLSEIGSSSTIPCR